MLWGPPAGAGGARLQEAQLVEGLHVELEVLLRRQQAGAQLAQHCGREVECLPQIVIVLRTARTCARPGFGALGSSDLESERARL